MQVIPLQNIPNQKFTITLDQRLYDFEIQETNGVMAVTLSRDDVILLSGLRLVTQSPVIPYHYLENGNFIIITNNDDLPYYAQFGSTQFLIYLSPVELAAAYATTA